MIRLALAAALLLAGCGERPQAPPPAPPPDSDRDAKLRNFISHMKVLDLQLDNLQADIAGKKPEDGIRERLGKIRGAAVAASKVGSRDSVAENRELEHEFDNFLVSLGRLEKAAWTGEDGARNWKSLQAACNACHAIYAKDE